MKIYETMISPVLARTGEARVASERVLAVLVARVGMRPAMKICENFLENL